jgi:hypothetical protein
MMVLMITKLTEIEALHVQIAALWFEPAKRAAIVRKLRKLEAKSAA